MQAAGGEMMQISSRRHLSVSEAVSQGVWEAEKPSMTCWYLNVEGKSLPSVQSLVSDCVRVFSELQHEDVLQVQKETLLGSFSKF